MKDCNEIVDCSGRREFLVKAAFMAGGLALTLSGAGSVFGKAFEDVTVTIDSTSPLNKVGGSTITDSTAGKIIILRTGEATFVAYTANCTHKGAIIEYDATSKQFVCPKHGSKFDSSNGNVVNGPAAAKLPSYPATGTTASVKVTIGS